MKPVLEGRTLQALLPGAHESVLEIGTGSGYLAACLGRLAREVVSIERRALPWVKVEKPYVFEGANGRETFADLFAGRSQLLVYHFMFAEGWSEGCHGCSFLADTADSLASILRLPPGLYHLDGNPGLNFFEIAAGLNRRLGEPWTVVPVAGLVQNRRMLDPRVSVAPITRRFPDPRS